MQISGSSSLRSVLSQGHNVSRIKSVDCLSQMLRHSLRSVTLHSPCLVSRHTHADKTLI